MPRNSTLDEMRAELDRRRRRHQTVALMAADAEAEYRFQRATKIKALRAEGHPATMCEYLADADPEEAAKRALLTLKDKLRHYKIQKGAAADVFATLFGEELPTADAMIIDKFGYRECPKG